MKIPPASRCLPLLLLAVLWTTVRVHAQDIGWQVDFHGFADNREYAPSGRNSQTILGTRIAPEIYFSLDSIHFLHAGVNYLHEFGADQGRQDRVSPTIYYNYKQKGHDFYIGMFPRKGLLSGYHRAILNDTLNYYRPNIEGLLWRYTGSTFHQQVWVDWTSRQTSTQREQFLAGISGRVNIGKAYIAHQFSMWHNAGTLSDGEQPPLHDNATAMVKLGVDLSKLSFPDSLDISAGGLIALDRLRGVYDWRTPKGFIVDLYAEYRKFFVANSFYAGESLPIVYGDQFYTATRYDRVDLGWKPLQYKGLEGQFTLSFHITPGAVDNQQQFSLRYHIGRLYTK